MHNALTRLQTAFGFFTSCAFTIAGVIAFLSLIPFPTPSSSPKASITARNVQVVKGRPHYYSPKREEYAQIRFDLNADLSPLFNWNTKQVFVYVTANYPNQVKDGEAVSWSETVIWDMIIPSPSTPYLWQNIKNQYLGMIGDKPKKSKSKSKSKKSTKGAASESVTTDITKPGLITLKNQKPKYQITDPTGIISERGNATLQVSWNVQPWVGALIWDKGYLGKRVGSWTAGKGGRSKPFDFPALKGAKPESVKNTEEPKPEAGEATPVVEI